MMPISGRRNRLVMFFCVACFCLLQLYSPVGGAQVRDRPARVGEIWFQDIDGAAPFREAFREGMRGLGYAEGKNIVYVTRYADTKLDRFPALIDELISERVDVLYGTVRALPAEIRAATSIPFVVAAFTDPVAEGFVNSLSKPGGNITGMSWQSPDTSGKRLELTLEVFPGLKRIAVLVDSTDIGARLEANTVRSVAAGSGVKVATFELDGSVDIGTVLEAIRRDKPKVLVLIHSPLTAQHRDRIARFAIDRRVALVSETRDLAVAGAMLTYGPSIADMFRRGAGYVDRILRGAKPGELPIEQPTKFELTVNLRTADLLGIKIPRSIVSRADEVIR